MTDTPDVKPGARDRILDAAALVMRERGLARTTTKEIARAAGYSEAMLYKHFADKQQLFQVVLAERLPAVHPPGELAGSGELEANLVHVVEQFMSFYVLSFPMAASILSTPELLRAQRETVGAHGGGPAAPLRIVRDYLGDEQRLGRIAASADLDAIATAMVGGAFHLAFLAAFEGLEAVPEAEVKAHGIVLALMPAITGVAA